MVIDGVEYEPTLGEWMAAEKSEKDELAKRDQRINELTHELLRLRELVSEEDVKSIDAVLED